MSEVSLREQIYDYVKSSYGCEIEHLWMRFPGFAVFRRGDTRKWFGLVADVHVSKLGLDKDEYVDILNVKVDDFVFRDMLIKQNGIYKGYHMGHNWISILLDGSVPFSQICELIDDSYRAVGKKHKTKG